MFGNLNQPLSNFYSAISKDKFPQAIKIRRRRCHEVRACSLADKDNIRLDVESCRTARNSAPLALVVFSAITCTLDPACIQPTCNAKIVSNVESLGMSETWCMCPVTSQHILLHCIASYLDKFPMCVVTTCVTKRFGSEPAPTDGVVHQNVFTQRQARARANRWRNKPKRVRSEASDGTFLLACNVNIGRSHSFYVLHVWRTIAFYVPSTLRVPLSFLDVTANLRRRYRCFRISPTWYAMAHSIERDVRILHTGSSRNLLSFCGPSVCSMCVQSMAQRACLGLPHHLRGPCAYRPKLSA